MVRRNPAFRIATGGLTVAVLLCLVGAISLLSSTPPADRAGAAGVAASPSTMAALQVATTGDESHLLDEHPRNLVPEPLDDHALTVSPLGHDDRPGPWTPRPEGDEPQYIELPPPPETEPVQLAAHSPSGAAQPLGSVSRVEAELTLIQGQVSELARAQLEAQLAEIHQAEQLLSTHQTNRMIEALQRDVDELKEQRSGVTVARPSHRESKDLELVPPAPPRHAENPLESVEEPKALHPASPTTPGESLPDPGNAPFSSVRFAETPETPGRYDVDADAASLTEMLAKLGPVAGWNLVSGPEMQGTVTYRWQGVDLQQALTQMLRVHGWQIRQDGEFAIVEQLPPPVSAPPEKTLPPSDTDDSEGPITLELAPESTGLLPPVNGFDFSSSRTQFRQGTHDSPPQHLSGTDSFRTESRPISYRSQGHAAPRVGRIVMKDYPELMAPGTSPERPRVEAPQWVEIEATILEIRPTAGTPHGVFRQALSVAGRGPCPRCGIVHHAAVGVGHSVEGWVDLGEGLSSGVCLMSPELITARLNQLSTTSVTASPRVNVLNQQLAEIALTEQPGFRRHMVRGEAGSEEVDFLQGGVQLSLRPTVGPDGLIRLDLRPVSAPSTDSDGAGLPPTHLTEFSASLSVPPDGCMVLGGLYFASERSPNAEGSATSPDSHEVVVLIRVRSLKPDELYSSETPLLPAPPPPAE